MCVSDFDQHRAGSNHWKWGWVVVSSQYSHQYIKSLLSLLSIHFLPINSRNREILPSIFGKLKGKRPKLVVVEQATDLLVEYLHLSNSPSFHLLIADLARAEVRYVNVTVDRSSQATLKAVMSKRLLAAQGLDATSVGATGLEPQDLNTDGDTANLAPCRAVVGRAHTACTHLYRCPVLLRVGIDPSGRDIWIHDCYIQNDDDSIAVKPCDGKGHSQRTPAQRTHSLWQHRHSAVTAQKENAVTAHSCVHSSQHRHT
jgi:hypothetical protein